MTSERMRRAGMLVAVLAGVLPTAGCVTQSVTTSDGRPLPPEPRAMKTPPTSATPNRVMLMLGQCEDTDGNGFPDLINVTTALFADAYATSLLDEGTFVLMLYEQGDVRREGAVPIAQWRRSTADMTATGSIVGPCYQLRLSLIDAVGSDMLPAMTADLRGYFEPASGGESVYASDERRSVHVGRRTGSLVLPPR